MKINQTAKCVRCGALYQDSGEASFEDEDFGMIGYSAPRAWCDDCVLEFWKFKERLLWRK